MWPFLFDGGFCNRTKLVRIISVLPKRLSFFVVYVLILETIKISSNFSVPFTLYSSLILKVTFCEIIISDFSFLITRHAKARQKFCQKKGSHLLNVRPFNVRQTFPRKLMENAKYASEDL